MTLSARDERMLGHIGRVDLMINGDIRFKAKRRMEATQAQPGEKVGTQKASTELYEPSSKGRAIDAAAKIVGVGSTTVSHAKEVSERDPELFKQIEAGAITVDRAHKVITGRAKRPESSVPHPPAKEPRAKRIDDIRRSIQLNGVI